MIIEGDEGCQIGNFEPINILEMCGCISALLLLMAWC